MQNEQDRTKDVPEREEHVVASSWSSSPNCHWQLSGKGKRDCWYKKARKEKDVAWEKVDLHGYTTKQE